MKRSIQQTVKSGRFALILALASCLVLAPLFPASAQPINVAIDPLEETNTWTQYLAEVEQYLQDNWQYILEDALQASGTSALMSGMAMQAQIAVVNAQATIDGQRQANLAHTVGGMTVKTTMSPQSLACAHAKGNQWKAASMSSGVAMGQAIQTYEQGVNAGTNASGGSAASASTEINDLCQLGFLVSSASLPTPASSRYGLLPTNKNCKPDPSPTGKYLDADMRISSVIDQLQFPLPVSNHVQPTKDGHLSFLGTSQNTSTQVGWQENTTYPGLGSEMDFAAAFKFCEHLAPTVPSPTVNGGTPVAADNVNIKNDRDFESLRTAAADECFRALWYRTACPKGTETTLAALNGGGTTCMQNQLNMCGRLVWPTPSGLGLTMTGHDPRFQSALKSCTDSAGSGPDANGNATLGNPANFQGLSAAMYDAIIAHKCDDANYSGSLAAVLGDATEAEHANQFECPSEEAFYQSKMDNERERLEVAIQNLIQMRGMGGGTSQTSRISQ